jgi:hypothetical protein
VPTSTDLLTQACVRSTKRCKNRNRIGSPCWRYEYKQQRRFLDSVTILKISKSTNINVITYDTKHLSTVDIDLSTDVHKFGHCFKTDFELK